MTGRQGRPGDKARGIVYSTFDRTKSGVPKVETRLQTLLKTVHQDLLPAVRTHTHTHTHTQNYGNSLQYTTKKGNNVQELVL